MHLLPSNFSQVTNNVYRSALPNTKHLQYLQKEMKLTAVIDLTDKPRDSIKRFSQNNNLTYYKFSMSSDIVNEDQVHNILGLINSLKNKIVLIHCFHGSHRTGLISSLLYKQSGFNTKFIVNQLFLFGFGDPQKHWEIFKYILTVC